MTLEEFAAQSVRQDHVELLQRQQASRSEQPKIRRKRFSLRHSEFQAPCHRADTRRPEQKHSKCMTYRMGIGEIFMGANCGVIKEICSRVSRPLQRIMTACSLKTSVTKKYVRYCSIPIMPEVSLSLKFHIYNASQVPRTIWSRRLAKSKSLVHLRPSILMGSAQKMRFSKIQIIV